MALETRGGNSYYYRKRREGRRVVSEYVAGGAIGEGMAALDALDRQDRDEARAAWRAERESLGEVDRAIDEALQMGRALLAGALLASGYHTHKGQWRHGRKR